RILRCVTASTALACTLVLHDRRRGPFASTPPAMVLSVMVLSPADATIVRERYGTPCFVYDRGALEAAARSALAFPHAFGFTLRYAMKANSSRAILRLFRALG